MLKTFNKAVWRDAAQCSRLCCMANTRRWKLEHKVILVYLRYKSITYRLHRRYGVWEQVRYFCTRSTLQVIWDISFAASCIDHFQWHSLITAHQLRVDVCMAFNSPILRNTQFLQPRQNQIHYSSSCIDYRSVDLFVDKKYLDASCMIPKTIIKLQVQQDQKYAY